MRRACRIGVSHLLLSVFLAFAACGAPRGEGSPTAGTTASERLEEARSMAEGYLPGGILYEILGLRDTPPFGNGVCPSWTYSFYSTQADSVVRVHLGRDGRFTVPGELEGRLPGQAPPEWDGEFSIDSDFAAKSIRIDGLEGFFSQGEPVNERLRLSARTSEGEVTPVWEITYTIHTDGSFVSQTVLIDAMTGHVLEDEP